MAGKHSIALAMVVFTLLTPALIARPSEVPQPYRFDPAVRPLCSPATLGHTATVFGATGFLGRYIVNKLGRSRFCPADNRVED